MKKLIIAALAAAGLGGCVAVPGPYYGETAYYPAPAIGVGIYSAPGYYYGGGRHGHGHRHHRRHH
jgi:hypothetical protein